LLCIIYCYCIVSWCIHLVPPNLYCTRTVKLVGSWRFEHGNDCFIARPTRRGVPTRLRLHFGARIYCQTSVRADTECTNNVIEYHHRVSAFKSAYIVDGNNIQNTSVFTPEKLKKIIIKIIFQFFTNRNDCSVVGTTKGAGRRFR
jgi:hypothetical protein